MNNHGRPPTLRRINRDPFPETIGGRREVPSLHSKTNQQQLKLKQASNTIMVQLPASQKESSGKLQPPGALAANANRASAQAKIDKFRRWRSFKANSVAQESKKMVMSGVATASNHPPAYQRNNNFPQSKYRQSNRDPPASVGNKSSQGSTKNRNVPDNSWIVRSDTNGNIELNQIQDGEVHFTNLSVHDVQLL